jgi:hypothetical protein
VVRQESVRNCGSWWESDEWPGRDDEEAKGALFTRQRKRGEVRDRDRQSKKLFGRANIGKEGNEAR